MSPVAAAKPKPSTDRAIVLRAFASTERLTWDQLLLAPVHWPRPSRLEDALEVAPGKMADGLHALGLTSVGALLEHLPRDSRDARTVSGLKGGEAATVAVQVRTIAARPVRRQGMKPLVEASVFDETGTMRATFFNQPWLAQRYKPGTRLVLHGKTTARGHVQRRPPRGWFGPRRRSRRGRERRGGGDRRPLPGDGRRQLDADPDARARL